MAVQNNTLTQPTPPDRDTPTTPLIPATLPISCKKDLFMLVTDGAFNDISSLGGIGYVLCRYSELPHLAGSRQHSSISAEESEGTAIREGIDCAISEGAQCILIFSDSATWVEAIQGHSNGLSWELHNLLEDIQSLLSKLSFWRFCKVPRTVVSSADMLAKQASLYGSYVSRDLCVCGKGSKFLALTVMNAFREHAAVMYKLISFY
ncbi:hypothetical protein FRX31_024776 [Thalictrum thalictroides]|uniref:RNase H type-1 domain-containing protein n=1 Tax=Thalictrum thalictroides TaxID=46969 RepID=A0A7J6VM21_THATH|nr:hypothetical protein FRX31_024776 [Thalictrum thalictroides]